MALNKTERALVALRALQDLMNLADDEERYERRFWVDPYLAKREEHSLEAHLLKDLIWEGSDNQHFRRMNINDFEQILALIDKKIRKQDTVMRFAITSRVRLAVALRFMGTGESFRSLESHSRVSRKTISKFVPEVFAALIECLQDDYIKLPSTASEWKTISRGFQDRWQFPHTLGAINGKHIRIRTPNHSEGEYHNDNGFFSIALLAVVDSNSRFIYIDVGGNGKFSDKEIFKNCSLNEGLSNGSLDIPNEEPLPGQLSKTPYYLIGDDIFALDDHMMKAYDPSSSSFLTIDQDIFNYRLSRAKKPVEMAFGALAARFRIFHRPLEVEIETCEMLIKTCCILHNYLTKPFVAQPAAVSEHLYEVELSPTPLPETFTDLSPQNHETGGRAHEIRENVQKYLVTDGDFPFQWLK